MRKCSKKCNQADSAKSHQKETIAKKRKLTNSDAKQGSNKFLNECQKKIQKDHKIYNRKGKLYFL